MVQRRHALSAPGHVDSLAIPDPLFGVVQKNRLFASTISGIRGVPMRTEVFGSSSWMRRVERGAAEPVSAGHTPSTPRGLRVAAYSTGPAHLGSTHVAS